MNRCWQDGDLRAFADGELPEESLVEIAEHLEICASCRERNRAISERAARVYGLMSALAENTAPIPTPRPRARQHWRLAALPLAAALVVGVVMLPKRSVVRPVSPIARAPAAAVRAVQPASVQPPTRIRHAKARPPADRGEEFLRLDDDPIETGSVVRIEAEDGDVQADLIVGPDGRARAIRMLANPQSERKELK